MPSDHERAEVQGYRQMLRSVVVAVLLLASFVVAHAGNRIAFVVGVSHYEHARHLPNAPDDANGIAAALKRLGFDVETLLDPNRSALEAAVRRFADRSVGADVRLFHYSGYALESAEHNWLLPVNARLASERDLRSQAVDLNTIQEQADGAARVSIVFLDAARDNPFAQRLSATRRNLSPRGLARVDVAAGSVLEAYSTGPGPIAAGGNAPGRNSPFTAALLNHIETPGLEIKSLLTRVSRDVLEETKGLQRVWQNSSLVGEFYFVPPAVATASSAPSAIPLEGIFWDSIKTSRSPADFQAYLAKFPKGVFAELAQNRVATLQQETASASPGTIPAQDIAPAALLERAHALISTGNILSARLVLRWAYEHSDPQAALELGETYDPIMLKRINVSSVNFYADAAQARDWYMRAAELGSARAAQRIKELAPIDQ